jgi:hypothetical protein
MSGPIQIEPLHLTHEGKPKKESSNDPAKHGGRNKSQQSRALTILVAGAVDDL